MLARLRGIKTWDDKYIWDTVDGKQTLFGQPYGIVDPATQLPEHVAKLIDQARMTAILINGKYAYGSVAQIHINKLINALKEFDDAHAKVLANQER